MKSLILATIGLIVLSGCTSSISSQSLQDELQAKASNIAIMRDGTVWAVTNQGVARFDGQKWHYTNPEINAQIAATPDGTMLWLLTATQLSRYAENAWQTYALPNDYLSKSLELHTSAVGTAWLLEKSESRWQNTLLRFNGKHWQTIVVNAPDKFKPILTAKEAVFSLLGIDSEDRPWFSIVVSGTYITYYWNNDNLIKASTDFARAVFGLNGSLWASVHGSRFYAGRTSHSQYLTTGLCHYNTDKEPVCFMIAKTGDKVLCDRGELQITPDLTSTSLALAGTHIESFSVGPDNVAWALVIADYDYLDDTTLCPIRSLKQQLAFIRIGEGAWQRFDLVPCEYNGQCASLPFGSIKLFAPGPDNRSIWIVTDSSIGRLVW